MLGEGDLKISPARIINDPYSTGMELGCPPCNGKAQSGTSRSGTGPGSLALNVSAENVRPRLLRYLGTKIDYIGNDRVMDPVFTDFHQYSCPVSRMLDSI